jgi:hypothetical protein
MKKYVLACLLFLTSLCNADSYKTIYSPFTGKLDFVNATISTSSYSNTSGYANNSDKLDGYDASEFSRLNLAGLWEKDIDGYIMPIETVQADNYWELDVDNYLEAK